MKKTLFIIFTLVTCLSSYAQTNIDSLWAVWHNKSQTDSNRYLALQSIIRDQYLYSQPDSAFYYSQMLYDLVQEKGMERQKATVLNTQGITFYIRGNYGEALNSFEKSLKVREKRKDSIGIAEAHANIGSAYLGLEDTAKSIEYYKLGLKEAEQIDDKYLMSSSLNNLATTYLAQGNIVKASDHFNRSLKLHQETNDQEGIALCLNNMGDMHFKQKDFPKALEYYKQSLELNEEIGNKLRIAGSLLSIGSLYYEWGDHDLSKDYSTRGLEMAMEIEAPLESQSASRTLYKLYKEHGDFEASLKMHELYMSFKDSLENAKAKEELIKQDYQHEYEKQMLADSLRFENQRKLDKLTYRSQLTLISSLFIIIIIISVVYLRIRFIKRRAEKEALLQEIKLLKSEMLVKHSSETKVISDDQPELDKAKIEATINAKLNPSDWNILNVLYQNPVITNPKIAEEVNLSLGGVKSSLSKMYHLFNIEKTKENQRISLVIEAIKVSSNT